MLKMNTERPERWFGAAIAILAAAAISLLAFGLLTSARADSLPKSGAISSLVPVSEVANATPSWTGAYVSAGVGYSTTEVFGLELGENVAYTAGIGYDYRIPNTRLVAGVLADYTFPGEASGVADLLDGSWYVGSRLGALLSDSLLAYGSVGYTGHDLDAPGDFEGLTLGAGAELMVTQHVALKLDWRHVNLGDMGGAALTSDELRAFLSYRF